MNDNLLVIIKTVLVIPFMAGLSTWTLALYYQIFLDKKRILKSEKIIWLIYFTIQIFINYEQKNLPESCKLLINIFSVLIVGLWYRNSIINVLFVTIIYLSIWLLLESLTGLIFIVIKLDFISIDIFGTFVSKILLFTLVQGLKQFFYDDNIQTLPNKYNMFFILIPVGSIYVVYNTFIITSNSDSEKIIKSSYFSLLVMLVINILIFNLYINMSQFLELKRKNAVYVQKLAMYSQHIKEKKDIMQEFKKIHHDLRYQLFYLLELAEAKEYERQKDYLAKLINKKFIEELTIADSENLIIDALINYKYNQAKKSNIDFLVKLEVPTTLPFDDVDLCIILGNILDNAIEANEREGIDYPYIKLTLKLDKRNLFIYLENSYNGKIKLNQRGDFLTVKEDKENHGIGLNSIKKSINKFNGYMKADVSEKIFYLTIILYADNN